ncbi:coiled-coil domain-containing protein 103 [Bufo bufo]|uniref:coiled-coil domain-containing protein 103 n=1 Tax=Bufo bufo TaxID=8384 RepID=UPI001ABDFD7F|nr:coiled-coil domain-containing protein 103 [Bufo bufo]
MKEELRAMNDSEVLDFRELERELANAVAADEKYQRENAAKFRAIHQKVASYEEFRDIVAASNLKPLEWKDKIGGDRKQPWNPTATTSSSSKEPARAVLQDSLSEPRNAFEFSRDWRRIDMKKKYDFLLKIGAETLSHIFHAEVCSGLLGEFLLVLEEHLQDRQVTEVMEILQCLAKTPRFNLNLDFLGKTEMVCCHKLLEKLQTLLNDENEEDGKLKSTLKQLTTLYKVNESIN